MTKNVCGDNWRDEATGETAYWHSVEHGKRSQGAPTGDRATVTPPDSTRG